MSSPVQVLERVLHEGRPNLSGIRIRPWEFMNYYSFPYPAAEAGTVAIAAELDNGPDTGDPGTERYRMQLAVSSEQVTPEARASMNVTLVLDTSGSMTGEPIALLRESCKAIAASLKAGDNVSVVEWDTANAVHLANHAITGPNDPALIDVIDKLESGGGTDLHGGLSAGYELAYNVWASDRINRVVIVSDGGANVGITSVDLISEHAELNGQDGIYLVGVGVGGNGYNDDLMDRMTDAGKGASVFIHDEAEAWHIFRDSFASTMQVAARDVQVELHLPPSFELVKFSGEESSTDPEEVEPQHLAPNDAMVFYQELDTCDPDSITPETEFTVTARYKDAISFEAREVAQTFTFGELLGQDPLLWPKGAAVLAYAQALRRYKKADGNDAQAEALAPAFAAVEQAQSVLPEDAELQQIARVLDELAK
ncbi:MAG: VWA domain-containing protein [Myxococcales bacterium FL481]|nr:MAG: VWA domain-containing protein [Myxococcales bacterium FL481]